MSVVDRIDRLVGSIQFDRWVFGFPTLFTVKSHEDQDHDPLKSNFDFPEPLVYSDNCTPGKRGIKKTVYSSIYVGDGTSAVVKRVKLTPVGPRTLSRLIGVHVWRLHAFWWFVATKDVLLLFVGDLYCDEIPLLRRLLEAVPNLDALLLVSYGGLNPPSHGVGYRDQMVVELGDLAEREREKGRVVYALPHPLVPRWAMRAAQRV